MELALKEIWLAEVLCWSRCGQTKNAAGRVPSQGRLGSGAGSAGSQPAAVGATLSFLIVARTTL